MEDLMKLILGLLLVLPSISFAQSKVKGEIGKLTTGANGRQLLILTNGCYRECSTTWELTQSGGYECKGGIMGKLECDVYAPGKVRIHDLKK
jgi:hypothetical protein